MRVLALECLEDRVLGVVMALDGDAPSVVARDHAAHEGAPGASTSRLISRLLERGRLGAPDIDLLAHGTLPRLVEGSTRGASLHVARLMSAVWKRPLAEVSSLEVLAAVAPELAPEVRVGAVASPHELRAGSTRRAPDHLLTLLVDGEEVCAGVHGRHDPRLRHERRFARADVRSAIERLTADLPRWRLVGDTYLLDEPGRDARRHCPDPFTLALLAVRRG